MNQLLDALDRHGERHVPSRAFSPIIFDPANDRGQSELTRLLRKDAALVVCDRILSQIRELVTSRHPDLSAQSLEHRRHVEEYVRGRPEWQIGSWVFFPWCGRLVHLLPPEDFRELRTSRNKYKITPREQAVLGSARIGVVGLSVGFTAALALALEGIGGELRLADFDELTVSNMNRLPHGVADLGANKAIIAARRISELDPYQRVVVFAEGLRPDVDDNFFERGGRLDVIVEECDDLSAKVRIRERAKALKIPVIMETNDRGMLDIERFDVEPMRPVLHNLIGDIRAEALRELSTREKAGFVIDLLGGAEMSPALAGSLVEINETISGWPQLGSGTLLGGALVADAVRRLLLDNLRGSGRYYVDLDSIVSDTSPRRVFAEPRPVDPAPRAASISDALEPLLIPRLDTPLQASAARVLVDFARLAPSAGNSQPWKFRLDRSGTLECLLDQDRCTSFLDFERRAAYLALGASVENITLAAKAGGLIANVRTFRASSDALRVASITFARSESLKTPPLAAYLRKRCTNRALGSRIALEKDDLTALAGSAAASGVDFRVISRPESLDEAAEILGMVDRLRVLSPRLHEELVSEIRWTQDEARRTKDGIDIATLELPAADLSGMRLLSSRPVADFVRSIDGGASLKRLARRSIDAASALFLLSVPGTSSLDYFEGGRAMQRLWLEATRLGIAVQPLTVAPYLFMRLVQGGAQGLDQADIVELSRLWTRFQNLFGLSGREGQLLLARLSKTNPPRTRSLRRPVEDILEVEVE